jgi:23S rRNA (cytosine1962-C5)-methyltransferase
MPLASSIEELLIQAIRVRSDYLQEPHETAFRLLNGFFEGSPDLVIDVYGRTLVVWNYAEDPQVNQEMVTQSWNYLMSQLPWLNAVLVKTRHAKEDADRRGVLVYGQTLARKVRENGIWYALDLTLNLDASLYLDTRLLRAWAREHLGNRRVLNTFAYTGSLGVAAMAGGARQVIQMDLNRRFLNLAKDSYSLNGFPVRRADFRTGDFWAQASQLIRAGELFDCVFVDPPFFSVTQRGTVDLVSQSQKVINKVRPLVAHQGWLVVVNNALFVSGADYLRLLEGLCADGYLTVEERISVPSDFTGFPETRCGQPPVDPAPFNHPTKIVVLRAARKDGRVAE